MLPAIVFFQGSGLAVQQEPSEGPLNTKTEAAAQLMNAADFLSQARQFSVSIRAGYDVVQKTGEKIEFNELRRVTMVRPDHMRVDVERGDGDKTIVLFDGRDITVSSPDQKMYSSVSHPGDVDQTIHFFIDDLHLKLPLAMMFVKDLPSELQSRVRSVAVVENDVTMDVPCTQLAARTNDVDFQIWIPSKGDPLPRRVVITYKNAPGQPQFRANFSEWNLSPNLPEGFFAFNPSQDVQRIPFLAMLETAGSEARQVEKGEKK
jgi:hypothetical protein